jgi:hypothetical protein
MKEHNFSKQYKKLAKTYKEPFKVTKMHPNLIRTKSSKHDKLLNTNIGEI